MAIKQLRRFGNQTPWVWSIEPVHGCNLNCGHCSARLAKPNEYYFMTKETWINAFKIIREVGPTRRIDLCVTGEPTLHDDLLEFLRIAREINPLGQIQITTNGTQIIKGKYTYKQLLDAGANIIYTDTYNPREQHKKLAEESGFMFYEYYGDNKMRAQYTPWKYYGPHLKMITLQNPPDKWPASRFRAGLLGTWYNHLDWEAAKKYGLSKVEKPLTRRCNQPFLYATICYSGDYLLCCQDGFLETKGKLGSVNEGGVEGFKRFWFSKQMQTIRRRLRQKNRAGTSYCSRCCVTWSRCDFKHWTDEQVDKYYNGVEWEPMPPYES